MIIFLLCVFCGVFVGESPEPFVAGSEGNMAPAGIRVINTNNTPNNGEITQTLIHCVLQEWIVCPLCGVGVVIG